MEFRPLITVEPGQLFDLLEEERQDWLDSLSWDPSAAQQLLLQYVGHHLLPGFAACADDRVVGYTYYLTRARTGLLGTLYMSRSCRSPDIVRELLATTLSCLRSVSSIERIEAQIFPFGVDLVSAFSRSGFQTYRRHYLCRSSPNAPAPAPHAYAPSRASFHLVPWSDDLLEKSAMVIQAGYMGSIDREICSEYATYESCLTFARNLINNPGCGLFLPQASFMAVDADQRPAGVVLASRLAPANALIAQISVVPGYQGGGVGSTLMTQALRRLRALGFTQTCLSVSEQNEKAYCWYRRLGFVPRKELLAFVWRGQAV